MPPQFVKGAPPDLSPGELETPDPIATACHTYPEVASPMLVEAAPCELITQSGIRNRFGI